MLDEHAYLVQRRLDKGSTATLLVALAVLVGVWISVAASVWEIRNSELSQNIDERAECLNALSSLRAKAEREYRHTYEDYFESVDNATAVRDDLFFLLMSAFFTDDRPAAEELSKKVPGVLETLNDTRRERTEALATAREETDAAVKRYDQAAIEGISLKECKALRSEHGGGG